MEDIKHRTHCDTKFINLKKAPQNSINLKNEEPYSNLHTFGCVREAESH